MLKEIAWPAIPILTETQITLYTRARCPEEVTRLAQLFADPALSDLEPLRPIPLYLEDPYTGVPCYLETLILTATYQTSDGEIHAELCRALDSPVTAILRRLVEAQTGLVVHLV